jgi:hypothetical protein
MVFCYITFIHTFDSFLWLLFDDYWFNSLENNFLLLFHGLYFDDRLVVIIKKIIDNSFIYLYLMQYASEFLIF